MANPSYLALTKSQGQILCSGQLTTTSPTAVYVVHPDKTAKIASGTVCNTSGSPVTISVSLLKSGDTSDGTHAVISGYVLAAGDTLSLTEYLGGAMLAENESVSVTASVANVIDVVLTGTVSV